MIGGILFLSCLSVVNFNLRCNFRVIEIETFFWHVYSTNDALLIDTKIKDLVVFMLIVAFLDLVAVKGTVFPYTSRFLCINFVSSWMHPLQDVGALDYLYIHWSFSKLVYVDHHYRVIIRWQAAVKGHCIVSTFQMSNYKVFVCVCHLRSIVAHRDHFIRHLSVCLSGSHAFW